MVKEPWTRADKLSAWSLGITIGAIVLAVLAILFDRNYLSGVDGTPKTKDVPLLGVFQPARDGTPDSRQRCFTKAGRPGKDGVVVPGAALSFRAEPAPMEKEWVQCANVNVPLAVSEYRFDLPRIANPDAALVRFDGTFGVERGSFTNGARAHWVVQHENAEGERRTICSIPRDGAALSIATVSLEPASCPFPSPRRLALRDGTIVISQILDETRTDGKEEAFGGIVRPTIVVQD